MNQQKSIAMASLTILAAPDGMRPLDLASLHGDVLEYIAVLEQERDEHDAEVIEKLRLKWINQNYDMPGGEVSVNYVDHWLQSNSDQLRQKPQEQTNGYD